jgi:hypothetical protein
MLFADCPFCDTPALVDEARRTLACGPCSLTVLIDDEPVLLDLAAAA